MLLVKLNNAEVLENLKKQLVEINKQYEQLATTRMKVMGAIDVLEQIVESGKESTEPEPEENEETTEETVEKTEDKKEEEKAAE